MSQSCAAVYAHRPCRLADVVSLFPNGFDLISTQLPHVKPPKTKYVRRPNRLQSARHELPDPVKTKPRRAQSAIVIPKSKPKPRVARSLDKVQRTNSIECIETQLNSIRTQIDKLEEKFTEPIPESIVAAGDDVTFNNSDSKRWFARESYSLRLDIDSIGRIQPKTNRLVHIVKLHRTIHRVLQVAASRPMLRILQPKIHKDLGSLIRDLVAASDANDLPWWDTDAILSALEIALEDVPPVKQHAKLMNQPRKKRVNRCASATKVKCNKPTRKYPTDKDTVLKMQSKSNTLNVYIPFRT